MLNHADHGDHHLVLDGVHEHFLSVRYHDPGLSKTSAVCDWLTFADVFDEMTRFSFSILFHFDIDLLRRIIPGGFSLLQYIPCAAAATHTLCAQDAKVRLKWPTVDRKFSYAQKQRANILKEFVENSANKAFLLQSKEVCSFLLF